MLDLIAMSTSQSTFPDIVKIIKKETVYSVNDDGKINGEYQLSNSKIYRAINEEDLKFDASDRVLEFCIGDVNNSTNSRPSENSELLEVFELPEDSKSNIKTSGSKRKREQKQDELTLDISEDRPKRKKKKVTRYENFVMVDNKKSEPQMEKKSGRSWRDLISDFKEFSDMEHEKTKTVKTLRGEFIVYLLQDNWYINLADTKILIINCHLDLATIFEKYSKDELLSQDLLVKYSHKSGGRSYVKVLVCVNILEKCMTGNERVAGDIEKLLKNLGIKLNM